MKKAHVSNETSERERERETLLIADLVLFDQKKKIRRTYRLGNVVRSN